jgi:hypothetical protein
VNLSERLAKAAQDRRRQHEMAAHGVEVTHVGHLTPDEIEFEFESVPSFVPARTVEPFALDDLEPMRMRLPDPTDSPTADPTPADESGPLPLWERPLADVLRDRPLATVTELPTVPHEYDTDDDYDSAPLAPAIPMRGDWVVPPVAVDRDELHVPPLAAFEAEGLASGALRAEHMVATHALAADEEIDPDVVVDADSMIDLTDAVVIDLDDVAIEAEIVDNMNVIDLDDVAVDAEIVEPTSADDLLDQWTAGVSAYAHDRQEKVDGLYQRLADAAQRPRITFGPLDLRDGNNTTAAVEHVCPQCGAAARIDIHDPVRGRIHLSCDSCFKMWQERVESTQTVDEPFMRD